MPLLEPLRLSKEFNEITEIAPILLCERRDIGEEPDQGNGENREKGMGNAAFGAETGNFLRNWAKISRGFGWDILTPMS